MNLHLAARRLSLTVLPMLILLGWTSMAGAATVSATRSEHLLEGYADRFPSHGLAAAVLEDGGVTYLSAGTDVDGEAVTEQTPFRIASMSKSFTAATVMVLAERGEVDLDAPLTDSLPAFAMADERADAITLRMLLAHTSGIGGGSTHDLGRGGEDGGELLADLRDETLSTDPGSEHHYVNTNYALAALAVEQVTGQPFEQAQQRELLEPLGMSNTTATVDCADSVPGLGSGHTSVFGLVLPFPEPSDLCLGSGGVVTTASDLATWVDFQAGDGTAEDGTRVLSAEALTELHTAQPGTGTGADGYGLGWSFAEHDGVTFLEHGGALATWTSHLSLVVDDAGRPTGEAALVLSDTIGAPSMLARGLAAEAAGVEASIPASPVVTADRVALALIALVALPGVVGLVRAGSWPARRTSTRGRLLGLGWPLGLTALGLALPQLLAYLAFGQTMGFGTAWHQGAAMLPSVALVAVTMIGVGTTLCAARTMALLRGGYGTRPVTPPAPAAEVRHPAGV